MRIHRWRATALLGTLAVSMLLSASVVHAVTVESMNVDREDGSYRITSTLVVSVPLKAAFRAATDFERLPEFLPSVISNQRLGGHRIRSDLHMCVALFCRNVRQVMRYRQHAPHVLDMQVVSGSGDLKNGYANWRFAAVDAGHTRLTLDSAIEPAFWVPPLIGPYLIARKLRSQAEITGRAIEALAADYARNPDSDDSARDTNHD